MLAPVASGASVLVAPIRMVVRPLVFDQRQPVTLLNEVEGLLLQHGAERLHIR